LDVNSYGSPSNSQTNNSTPTDKKAAVTGIKREQVLNNDPLLDPSNSPAPSNEPEDEYPPVVTYEAPKIAAIPRYLIQQSVDPYLSPNESTKPKQHVDKIDGLAESFIRTCRFVECFSNYLNLLSL